MSAGNESKCPHCGASMKEHRHRLGRPLVDALAAMYRKARLKPCLLSDLDLSYSAQSNFQKLRYWLLIERAETSDRRRGGCWQVTAFGERFLRGDDPIRPTAWTFRARVQRLDGDAVWVGDIVAGYDFRADYAEAAVPRTEESQQLELGASGEGP